MKKRTDNTVSVLHGLIYSFRQASARDGRRVLGSGHAGPDEAERPDGPATAGRKQTGGARPVPGRRRPVRASGIGSALLGLLIANAWGAPTPAAAQVEVETDPFAYALNGFSLHVAGIFGGYRGSIGTFGIDVPRFFHRNDDYSVVMRGVGIKWDYLGARSDGFFVGADAGYMRMSYTLDETRETEKRDQFTVGVRGGYRLQIGRSRLYLAPWIGVGFSTGQDVTIGGSTLEHSPLIVFPTVHVGWRF